MGKLLIQNINQGGISDTKYVGLDKSMAEIVGMDIHGEPGLIQVNQRLKKDSGTTIDDFVKAGVVCSDGNTYFFGSTNGNIWKRTSAGVYTLEATNANGGILNAQEYEGYVYYFSANTIGRWKIGDAWSARTDSWEPFKNGNATYHPSEVLNIVLYVGDGNLVAEIREYGRDSCDLEGTSTERTSLVKPAEGMYYYDITTNTIWTVTAGVWVNLGVTTYTVFTNNALDIEKKYIVSALTKWNYQLIIGTIVTNESKCKIFRWDTWSISYASEDEIPVRGVNGFIETDNYVLCNCGEKGDLYSFDGSVARQVKKIPGNYGVGKTMIINPNASENYLGDPLFGVSNLNGNPCLQGVYSFTSYSEGYNTVLNLEYPISQKQAPVPLNYIYIGAILNFGDNIFVTWKDGATYGIDIIDTANKASDAYMTTRKLMVDRGTETLHKVVKIGYRDLPAGCDVEVWVSVNDAAYIKRDTLKDTTKKIICTKENVAQATSVQYKFVPIVSGNDAPSIEIIEINY